LCLECLNTGLWAAGLPGFGLIALPLPLFSQWLPERHGANPVHCIDHHKKLSASHHHVGIRELDPAEALCLRPRRQSRHGRRSLRYLGPRDSVSEVREDPAKSLTGSLKRG
jgi:hypothetical protein